MDGMRGAGNEVSMRDHISRITLFVLSFLMTGTGGAQILNVEEIRDGTNVDYKVNIVPEHPGDADDVMKKLWELEERNAREYEPELRWYETNTTTICNELLQLISESRINAAIFKEIELVEREPARRMMRKKKVSSYPRTGEAMAREAIVHLRILWCLYQSIQLAEKMDMERATEIFIEEKSFDDWSFVEKTEKKRKEMQRNEAKYAAQRRKRELDGFLRESYEKMEDELIYRLDKDRRENNMEDYNRFAGEIKRLITDSKLAEKLLRADKVTEQHRFELWAKSEREAYIRSLKEGHKRTQAWIKKQQEERMRQQRERNREIMEEERQRAKRRGGGK